MRRMQWLLVAALVAVVAGTGVFLLLDKEPGSPATPSVPGTPESEPPASIEGTATPPDEGPLLPDTPPDGEVLEESAEPLPNTVAFLEGDSVSDHTVAYQAGFQTHSIGPGDENDRTVVVVFSEFTPEDYVEEPAELSGRAAVLHLPAALRDRITTVGSYSGTVSLKENDGFYILVLSELD